MDRDRVLDDGRSVAELAVTVSARGVRDASVRQEHGVVPPSSHLGHRVGAHHGDGCGLFDGGSVAELAVVVSARGVGRAGVR